MKRVFREGEGRSRTQVVATIAVGGVVVIAAGSAFWMDDPDWWGAFGQWMGAGGTVLAVVVALRIARGESNMEATRLQTEAAMEATRLQAETDRENKRLQAEADRENTRLQAETARENNRLQIEADRESTRLRIESERLQAELREREIKQARLVTVRVEDPDPDEDSRIAPEVYVVITNHSFKPIMDLRLESFEHPSEGGVAHWDFDDPADSFEGHPEDLPAADKVILPISVHYEPPLTDEEGKRTRQMAVIVFTDGGGIRWRRRTGASAPERVSETDAVNIGGPSWYH